MVLKQYEDSCKRFFSKIGARITFFESERRYFNDGYSFREGSYISVEKDKYGEYFTFFHSRDMLVGPIITNVSPEKRHLLFIVQNGSRKEQVLCGFDERHWFRLYLQTPCSTVKHAIETLKPDNVVKSQADNHVNKSHYNKRNNNGFKRQGEWFFIPEPSLKPNDKYLYHNYIPYYIEHNYGICNDNSSTIRKHHIVEELIPIFSSHVSDKKLFLEFGYARGKISHPDHYTIYLPFWHKVLPNTITYPLSD